LAVHYKNENHWGCPVLALLVDAGTASACHGVAWAVRLAGAMSKHRWESAYSAVQLGEAATYNPAEQHIVYAE
jgi:hypothetical protein